MSVAGDDVVLQVVLEHVLEPISRELKEKGLGERAEFVMHRLFGGDRGDMAVEEQLRRQQFAAHVGAPIALRMIEAYEGWDPLSRDDRREPLTLESVFGAELNKPLVDAIDAEARKAGAVGFALREVRFPIDLKEIDRTARSVLIDVLQAFAELVHRARADLRDPLRPPVAHARGLRPAGRDLHAAAAPDRAAARVPRRPLVSVPGLRIEDLRPQDDGGGGCDDLHAGRGPPARLQLSLGPPEALLDRALLRQARHRQPAARRERVLPRPRPRQSRLRATGYAVRVSRADSRSARGSSRSTGGRARGSMAWTTRHPSSRRG